MKCTRLYQLLPSLVAAHSIQSIRLESLEDGSHSGPRCLCIGQDVTALLCVDARDAVPDCCQLACFDNVETTQGEATHKRLLDRRSDMGAAGSMMVSHVFTTSTSRMALRETFFRFDFEPSVATSLMSECQYSTCFACRQNEMDTRRLRRHICAT